MPALDWSQQLRHFFYSCGFTWMTSGRVSVNIPPSTVASHYYGRKKTPPIQQQNPNWPPLNWSYVLLCVRTKNETTPHLKKNQPKTTQLPSTSPPILHQFNPTLYINPIPSCTFPSKTSRTHFSNQSSRPIIWLKTLPFEKKTHFKNCPRKLRETLFNRQHPFRELP